MSESWPLRLPDKLSPHTMELRIPYAATRSNWVVRCQQSKSGAKRGTPPIWYGFKSEDYRILREFALAPKMAELLNALNVSFFNQHTMTAEEAQRAIRQVLAALDTTIDDQSAAISVVNAAFHDILAGRG